jgi:hypothetical protein
LVRVHVDANDVDKAPIKYTRLEMEFRWNGKLFPCTWARGRNRYTAEVPKQWVDIEGEYTLTVAIRTGWNTTAGSPTDVCIIHRRTFVVEGDTTQIIIGGCLGGALVLGMVGVAVVLRRNMDSMARFLLSILKVEGLLAFDICSELWDIIGVKPLEYTLTHARVRTLTHTHTPMHAQRHTRTHARTLTHTHTHMNTRTRARTHTNTQTYRTASFYPKYFRAPEKTGSPK